MTVFLATVQKLPPGGRFVKYSKHHQFVKVADGYMVILNTFEEMIAIHSNIECFRHRATPLERKINNAAFWIVQQMVLVA
jgi:hypothetical protein